MAKSSKLPRATILILALLSQSCTQNQSTYTTPSDSERSELRFPYLDQVFPVEGPVPLFRILQELQRKEYVAFYPRARGDLMQSFQAAGPVRVRDLISALETSQGWTFDPTTRRFTEAVATHPLDNPDSFGRTPPGVQAADRTLRGSVSIEFRFIRVSAGLSTSGTNAGVVLEQFAGSIPEGVQASWSSTTERSYFEGLQSPQGVSGVVVDTKRSTVEAGLQFAALASRLPGQNCRITGTLEISTFSGSNLDRQVIKLPVQADTKLSTWTRLVRIRGADASMQAFWRHFNGSIGASGDAIDLEIRVE